LFPVFPCYTIRRSYEINDHLGNVRAVVSDVKDWHSNNSGEFTARVSNISNYYPFGMAQPGRSWSGSDYRYGYNGKEEDNEVKGGDGKGLDYGARWYDPRKARWDAVDPLFAEYSGDSPYLYSKNDPINIIDIEGEQPIRGQLAHIGQILGTMKKHITDAEISKDSWLKQITILAKSMGTDQYVYRSKKDGNFYQEPKSIAVSRYIYTTKGGWNDMKHFLTAAVETYHKGAALTLNLGYLVELEQYKNGSTSKRIFLRRFAF